MSPLATIDSKCKAGDSEALPIPNSHLNCDMYVYVCVCVYFFVFLYKNIVKVGGGGEMSSVAVPFDFGKL